ncbi:MAG: serine hydrolase [Bdellovibrionales bacterium]
MKAIVLFLTLSITAPSWARWSWPEKLRPHINLIVKQFSGELGLYVKDLESGETFSLYGDTWWYLASTIKLFVFIQLEREIEAGKLSWDQEVTIETVDYRDGGGQTNWRKPGSVATVRFLVEQMMWESDNAATDLLIKLIGLETLNDNLEHLYASGPIGRITSLLDVRKIAYGFIHENAHNLSNMDYFKLKKAKTSEKKYSTFLKLAGVKPADAKMKSVEEAFEKYYKQGFNSTSLSIFASVIENLHNGKIINPKRSAEILDLMSKCETGKERLAAGLPKNAIWMHKTGTQLNRVCDMGLVRVPGKEKDKMKNIVITACAQNFKDYPDADRILKRVAEAMTRSGVFKP